MNWTAAARRVIAEVFASLPAEAGYAVRRRALLDAYPFQTREMWPYKAWCKVQREALAPYRAAVEETPNLPELTLQGVECQWFRVRGRRGKMVDLVRGGCLVCLPLHQMRQNPEVMRWLERLTGDPFGWPMFLDWCEENGYEEFAAKRRK
jgi:hypothetical protein